MALITRRNFGQLVIAGGMAVTLGACGGNGGANNSAEAEAETTAAADGATYKIGVIQLVEHNALDAAN